ncbi:trypsin-like peptidase domain-containing protein [Ferrimicrobium sp.]|uniref:trypsin-like peptidase domain-containing protein n=2 Tax=Ferrimicrobium sp. TaxID=2926050 RepID=UPI0027E44BB9|nr:trypsin-like peptidase domain-containing protein [Ferrimicrobium sp.]
MMSDGDFPENGTGAEPEGDEAANPSPQDEEMSSTPSGQDPDATLQGDGWSSGDGWSAGDTLASGESWSSEAAPEASSDDHLSQHEHTDPYGQTSAEGTGYRGYEYASSWASPPPSTPTSGATKKGSAKRRGALSKRRFSGLTVLTAAVVAAVVAVGTSITVVHLSGTSNSKPVVISESSASPTAIQGSGLNGNGSLNVPQILAKVEPAVVDITAEGSTSNGFLGTSQFEDAGTGMIFSSSGLVLTNNHVIAGATSIQATLYNQSKSYPVKIVGTDPAHDVAVLQIEGLSGLPTVKFGNSGQLQVGDPVVAIGNALALQGDPTVTQGIVSALNRSITAQDQNLSEHLTQMIQTDAPINPGNSGGPLVNAAGQVVGMDTAIISSTSQTPAQNLGFAESIDSVLPVVRNILKDPSYYTKASSGSSSTATTTKAFLGVGIQTMNAQAAAQLGYPTNQQGALIDYIYPGSPASNAGLTSGDVIIGFDGKAVTDASELVTDVTSKSPGTSVTLKVLSQSGTSTMTITLGNAPAA